MIFTRRFGALAARSTLNDAPETEREVDQVFQDVERNQVEDESAA